MAISNIRIAVSILIRDSDWRDCVEKMANWYMYMDSTSPSRKYRLDRLYCTVAAVQTLERGRERWCFDIVEAARQKADPSKIGLMSVPSAAATAATIQSHHPK
jgi:hypothetical protein